MLVPAGHNQSIWADAVSPRLLNEGAVQLAPVLCRLFNMSLKLRKRANVIPLELMSYLYSKIMIRHPYQTTDQFHYLVLWGNNLKNLFLTNFLNISKEMS